MTLSPSDSLRQRLRQRFEAARQGLHEEEESSLSLLPPSLSVSLGPLARSAEFPSAPAAEGPGNLRYLTEEVEHLRRKLVEAREAEERLGAEAEGLKAEAQRFKAEREERDRLQEQSLLKERESAAQAERIKELEAFLQEKENALSQARAEAARLAEELKEAQSLAQELSAKGQEPSQVLLEKLAEQERHAHEASQRAQGFEDELAKRDKELERALHDQGDLRAALAQKETDIRLLNENINRLVRHNKELLSKLQEYQKTKIQEYQEAHLPTGEVRETDPRLQEKLESLEAALSGRDRMLADQQKNLAEKEAALEGVFSDLKALDEQAIALLEEKNRVVEELTRSVQELSEQNETLKRALAERGERPQGPAPSAPEDAAPRDPSALKALEEKLRQNEEHARKALAEKDERLSSLEKEKASLEGRIAAQSEELKKTADLCEQLRQKNQELETQSRLLVMNVQTIERMENSLREAYRLIPPDLSRSPVKAAAAPAPGAPEGLWARFRRFFSFRRAAPPPSEPRPSAAPPGVERLRALRSRRSA